MENYLNLQIVIYKSCKTTILTNFFSDICDIIWLMKCWLIIVYPIIGAQVYKYDKFSLKMLIFSSFELFIAWIMIWFRLNFSYFSLKSNLILVILYSRYWLWILIAKPIKSKLFFINRNIWFLQTDIEHRYTYVYAVINS